MMAFRQLVVWISLDNVPVLRSTVSLKTLSTKLSGPTQVKPWSDGRCGTPSCPLSPQPHAYTFGTRLKSCQPPPLTTVRTRVAKFPDAGCRIASSTSVWWPPIEMSRNCEGQTGNDSSLAYSQHDAYAATQPDDIRWDAKTTTP